MGARAAAVSGHRPGDPGAGQAAVADPAVAPALISRAPELASLVAAIRRPPAVVVIEGEAGIGKTRLITELRRHGDSAGHRFAVGACRRIREPFPLGPVIEAVRGLGAELVPARLSPVAGALRPLVPELAELLPPQPQPLADRAAERHRVFRGLVDVLASLGPAVLVLEDLHWSDEHTADFVSYLVGDPPPRLSMLLTYRGEEVQPAVRAAVAKLPAAVHRTRVVLGPLDAANTGALAAAILGLDRVSASFAEYLCERAAGVPFAIEELLALLRDRGELARRGGGWARRALSELDVPASINDQVLERVSRLDAVARAVVEAAAVLHGPVLVPVLLATCGGARARAQRGVAAALRSGLLVEQGELVGFRHALAAQAIYEGLPGQRRQQLHGRAVSAVGAMDPVPLGQLAHHLRHAGQLARYTAIAEQAADQASGRGHDDEAVRLLEGALRETPRTAPHRGRLAVKLASTALQMLHFDAELVGLLSAVLDQQPPGTTRGELRLRLALLLERTGADSAVQRRLFAGAVAELADRPELAAQAMVALAMPGAPGVRLAEHRGWLHRIMGVLPAVGGRTDRVGLLGKVAMVQVWTGDPRWRRTTARMVAMTGGAAGPQREVIAYYSVGASACYAGQLTAAGRLVSTGLDGALAGGYEPVAQWLEAVLALLDYCRGAWDGLAERAEVLTDRLADDAVNRADVEVVAGCLALARGGLDRAGRQLGDVAGRLDRRGGYDLLPMPRAALIRLALARDDVDGAATAAHRFRTAVDRPPFQVTALRALPAVVEAMVAAGQVGAARAVAGRWRDQVAGLDAPLAPAVLPHAGGLLAAAAQQWPDAAAGLLTAASRYDRLRLPYESAQAREQAAAALSRVPDQQAVAELRTAWAAFRRIGATWDLDRVSATLRRHGLPVPARNRRGRRGYGPGLSPREREVAGLAAAGRTNKEIAEVLFLSPNTVKKQLGSAMRKLGVDSRRALTGEITGTG